MDWQAAADFLAGAAFAPPAEVIETHTARIHLAGDTAWKLRRPVDYGWLDYASRARRRLMAEREIAWNGAAAPGLYLGLGGVVAGPRLLAPGESVPAAAEPLVVMRRFPQEALLDRMAAAGALDRALMERTGAVVAAMHRASPPAGPAMRLPAFVAGETADLVGLRGRLGAARVERLTALLRRAAERLAGLAASRPVRRCHGDLHLRNIVLWRGVPAPFDCIEFNEAFSHIDPLYDLAFLLMDLSHRGQGGLRAAVLNAWAEGMADGGATEVATAYGGLALLPLHEACRAAIRAKTGALAGDPTSPEALDYADLAIGLLEAPPEPRLIAVGGRSGTGKSTLARALADRLGAVVLRSDAIRKGLAGIAAAGRLPPGAYTPAAGGAVYAEMRARARLALGGAVTILDATHLEAADRQAAAALAREAGVAFAGLWLEAGTAALAARLAARRGDVSDATPEVLARQPRASPAEPGWTTVAADAGPEATLAAALAALAAAG